MNLRTRSEWCRGSPRAVAATAALMAVVAAASPQSMSGQAGDWRFDIDPFTDLWYHGLAMVGFDGSGSTPLYDAEYAWAVVAQRRAADIDPTPLEVDRTAMKAALAGDPAFEVLHFVPLYLTDAPIDVALNELEGIGRSRRTSRVDVRIAREIDVLSQVLKRSAQHETLGQLVQHLRVERDVLASTGGPADFDARTRDLDHAWSELLQGPLGAFLEREGFFGGRVVVTKALGAEGRVLERGGSVLVVVGAGAESGPVEIVGAVVRELCYPPVRRSLGPYESWFDDRATVSDVSSQAASRCGALLLEAYAPELLATYQTRFGPSVSEAAFLSGSGFRPGTAAVEGQLDAALRRELQLDEGDRRAEPGGAGR